MARVGRDGTVMFSPGARRVDDLIVEDGAGEPEEVVRTGSSLPRDLAISTDGKRIAYSVTTFSSNLWAIPMDPKRNLASGTPRPLVTDTSYCSTIPVFSPDARKIAFDARRRGTHADIMMFDRDSGAVSQMTTAPSAGMVPSWTAGRSWSGDSTRMAFAALRDGAWNLWWVTRDGSRQQRLTGNALRRVYVRDPEWSRAGDMLAYEFAETKGNVFIADVR
jgi:Tol biopolymer transport system component